MGRSTAAGVRYSHSGILGFMPANKAGMVAPGRSQARNPSVLLAFFASICVVFLLLPSVSLSVSLSPAGMSSGHNNAAVFVSCKLNSLAGRLQC